MCLFKIGDEVTARHRATRRNGDLANARFALASKAAVYLLVTRGALIFRGCGLDVYGQGVDPLSWLGLSRRRTESVLVRSRNVLSHRCWFYWGLHVQGIWTLTLSRSAIRQKRWPSNAHGKIRLELSSRNRLTATSLSGKRRILVEKHYIIETLESSCGIP
jgi:hypothetical protein